MYQGFQIFVRPHSSGDYSELQKNISRGVSKVSTITYSREIHTLNREPHMHKLW